MALKIPEAKLLRDDAERLWPGCGFLSTVWCWVTLPPDIVLLWGPVPCPPSRCCCFSSCSSLPFPASAAASGLLPFRLSSLFHLSVSRIPWHASYSIYFSLIFFHPFQTHFSLQPRPSITSRPGLATPLIITMPRLSHAPHNHHALAKPRPSSSPCPG